MPRLLAKKILLQKCEAGGTNCVDRLVEEKDIIIGKDGKIYVYNNGIFNSEKDALNNAAQQSSDAANAQGVYVIYNPLTGNPVAEVLYAGYDKLNEILGGVLPVTSASEANQEIRNIASEQGGEVVTTDHSRGSMTDSNSLADSLNRGETDLAIDSVTFNGAAANAQNMADMVNTATNGQGTVYQSTHVDDWVGTVIGGNDATGGVDGVGMESHGSYGPNAKAEKTNLFWGKDKKSDSALVVPEN